MLLKRGLTCLTVAAALFGISYVLKMLDSSLAVIADLCAFLCGISGLFTLTEWATQGEREEKAKKVEG